MMEYWNNGIIGMAHDGPNTPSFHHSNIPTRWENVR